MQSPLANLAVPEIYPHAVYSAFLLFSPKRKSGCFSSAFLRSQHPLEKKRRSCFFLPMTTNRSQKSGLRASRPTVSTGGSSPSRMERPACASRALALTFCPPGVSAQGNSDSILFLAQQKPDTVARNICTHSCKNHSTRLLERIFHTKNFPPVWVGRGVRYGTAPASTKIDVTSSCLRCINLSGVKTSCLSVRVIWVRGGQTPIRKEP